LSRDVTGSPAISAEIGGQMGCDFVRHLTVLYLFISKLFDFKRK